MKLWMKNNKTIRNCLSTFQEGLINQWNASPVHVNLTRVFIINIAAPHYSLSRKYLHSYSLPPLICYLVCLFLCNYKLLFDHAEKAIDLLNTKQFCNN